jgi:hypothetical protein
MQNMLEFELLSGLGPLKISEIPINLKGSCMQEKVVQV